MKCFLSSTLKTKENIFISDGADRERKGGWKLECQITFQMFIETVYISNVRDVLPWLRISSVYLLTCSK